MTEQFKIEVSPNGIKYIDYSAFLGTTAGIILRNPEKTRGQLKNEIALFTGNKSAASLKELKQKHTSLILPADSPEEIADGLYTSDNNNILMIKTADCLPVFIYDGTTAVLIHAGWRGCVRGIIAEIPKSVKKLDLGKCRAVIGPGIGQCCFEVGGDVALMFDAKYRAFDKKYSIDLIRFVVDEMNRFGIKSITVNNACTCCSETDYCSYRRDKDRKQQMLSFITSGGL